MNKNAGFTLIELLVVVLIIGILAAVALPQYRVAVMKTRLVQGMAILNALEKAQKEYYLSNGTYTTDLTALSVEIPASEVTYISCVTGFCQFHTSNGPTLEWVWEWNPEEQRHRCLAVTSNTTKNQVCASFGGQIFRTEENTNYWTMP